MARPRTPQPKRDARIAAMRAKGMTYAEIGTKLGLAPTTMWQIVTRYDKKTQPSYRAARTTA